MTQKSELKSIEIDTENKTVTIVADLIESVSSSAKSINLVSTGGFRAPDTETHYKYKGEAFPVKANINVCIPNPDFAKPKRK